MRKRLRIIAVGAAVLLILYLVIPGLGKAADVFIADFSVSDDGGEITLCLERGGSAGFIRKAAVYQQQGGKLYLDPYAAFGGINGSIGAKREFTVPLAEDTRIIAICRNADCYEEVLRKDTDGNWQRAD